MSNICFNFLDITGGEEVNKKAFIQSFLDMKEAEDVTGNYQFPKEIEETPVNMHFICAIDVNQENETISFSSRWSPPVQMLIDMGQFHSVSFESYYDEGLACYGCVIYNHETEESQDIMLEEEDLEQYSYDEDKEEYYFRNEIFESDVEILDILLTEKIKRLKK